MRPRRLDQRIRQPVVPAPQLHGQPAHPGPSQIRDVRGEQRRVVRQRDAGAQYQLTAVQQPGHIGQFHGVHPADGHPQTVAAGQDLGPPAAHDVQVQHRRQRRLHRSVS